MIYCLWKSNTPLGGCPLQGSLCIYFFFLDFLDFFCFTSWRAVNVKTKISTKSFIISSISCMVSIPLLSFPVLYTYSFLSPFHDLIIYLLWYIVNGFYIFLQNNRGQFSPPPVPIPFPNNFRCKIRFYLPPVWMPAHTTNVYPP